MTSKFTDADILASGRHAGLVRRYHAWTLLQTQRIDAHSWQMLRIYAEIWGEPPQPTAAAIRMHDQGEIGAGDVPLYGKRDVPALKPLHDEAEDMSLSRQGLRIPTLDPTEAWRLKMCDLIEGLEHCLLDIQMGNRIAIPAMQNYMSAIRSRVMLAEPGHENYSQQREADMRASREYISRQLELHQRIMTAPVAEEL